ncbi:MAG: serine hydrolase domain-containing protein [bacterium]
MISETVISQMINEGISNGIFPGAVVCLYKEGEPLFLSAYGNRMIVPQKLPMLNETLFDLASLTKPIATATSILILKNIIRLNSDLTEYLPEFGKSGIKIIHLLTHTSGLPAWKPIYLEVSSRNDVVKYVGSLPLEYEIGTKVVYSCLGYILLGELIRSVTGLGLDEIARKYIFEPLGMNDTFFNPPEDRRYDCAATEESSSTEKRMTNYKGYNWREGVIVGEVHDENSHFLGGVAGNAGLFSTASDLAKYCQMIINDGENVLSIDSMWLMKCNLTRSLDGARSIGWIIMPNGNLYHTGFTGTSIEIDTQKRAFAILLTNRVHPDATKEGIIDFRQMFYSKWRDSL